MTQRGEWRFSYTGATLAAACERKTIYHAERVAHWTDRYEAAKDAAESQTVQVKVVTQQVTGGERAHIEADVDHEAAQELNLSQSKLETHRRCHEEFDRWHRGFSANSAATFELDPDDIAFFDL